MVHLRLLFESLGFFNVEIFIASGNVIFEAKTESVKTLEKKMMAPTVAGIAAETENSLKK